MAKRKADPLTQVPATNSSKKVKHDTTTEKMKPSLLDDSDSGSSDDDSVGGAKLEEPTFRINEEYAKRFEHNKKREELHKCQYFIQLYKALLSLSSGGEIPKDGQADERSVWRQIR
jgi:protein KRI1